MESKTRKAASILIACSYMLLAIVRCSLQADTSKAIVFTSSTSQSTYMCKVIGDPLQLAADVLAGRSLENYPLRSVNFAQTDFIFQAVAVDYAKTTTYIGNPRRSTLGFIRDNSSTYSDLLAAPVSTQVGGISVDWVSHNLYWSDTLYQRIGLITIRDNLTWWRPVIDTNLVSPQDVVVYPQSSYLFWSDVLDGTRSKISRSDLTGNQRIALYSSSSIGALALDLDGTCLFYLNTAGTLLGAINFDGALLNTWTLSFPISSLVVHKSMIFMGQSNLGRIFLSNTTQVLLRSYVSIAFNGTADLAVYTPESQPTVTSPCVTNNGGCAHICITTAGGGKTCQCGAGYFLATDGLACVTEPLQDNFVVVADSFQHSIYQLNLNTGIVVAVVPMHLSDPSSVAYDDVGKMVYWTDRALKNIGKTSTLDGTTTVLFVDTAGTAIFDGIALDVAREKIYYTDANTAVGKIGTLSMSGTNHQFIYQEVGAKPRAIVLDLVHRLMYWTDWGAAPRIQRASMDDGTMSHQILVNTGLAWPNALAIDFNASQMFWGDAMRHTLEVADLNGAGRRVIYQNSNVYFYGMALSPTYLYFTDWTTRSVRQLNRQTNVVSDVLPYCFSRLNGIAFYSSTVGTVQPVTDTTKTIIIAVVVGGVLLLAIIITVAVVAMVKHRNVNNTTCEPAVTYNHPKPVNSAPPVNPRAPTYNSGASYDTLNRDSTNDADYTRISNASYVLPTTGQYERLNAITTVGGRDPLHSNHPDLVPAPPPQRPLRSDHDYLSLQNSNIETR